MDRLRAAAILAAIALLTLVLLPVQRVALALDAPLARRLPCAYHRLVCRLLGLRLILRGAPVRDGPVLFVANHSSWLDIPILSGLAPLSFIAKSEVAGWPIFGTLARLQRTLFIERARRGSAGIQRDSAQARLRRSERLVLFPEGTSSDGNRVLPFKSALFGIAEQPAEMRPDLVVQPLSIAYVGLRGLPMARALRPFVAWYGDMELAPHLWQALRLGPVDVVVECHPPLAAELRVSRKLMAAAAECQVRAGLVAALCGRAGAAEMAEVIEPPPTVPQTMPTPEPALAPSL
jgi:1-acyl-sn-glycerol-3-phosphate acyltransferase